MNKGGNALSKIIFSKTDIAILEKNQNVTRVSEKSITYTDEFKRAFIEEYLKGGKSPRTIFSEFGFCAEMLGTKRYEQAAARWIKAYNKDGIIALRDIRKETSGRPRKKELSPQEIIEQQEAKISLLEGQVELLKKSDVIERRLLNKAENLLPSEIFGLIYETITKSNLKSKISYYCDLLTVSRSGYYNFVANSKSHKDKELVDLSVRDLILKAFNIHGFKKGSRSIKMTLQNEYGIIFNRKRIQRIMRKYNILCPIRKANPYRRMAKATKEHCVVPNTLKRNFKQGVAGMVLLTDITYLPYGINNMAYLSTIKDAVTNEILAYQVSQRITLDIATDTIHKLMKKHKNILTQDAFIHSDQGVHYTSPKYQKLLKDFGLKQSMSRRGNCWDNAPQESFFGHMKDEMNYKACQTFNELKKLINRYMRYYNNYRCQWNLKKLTPIQYRNQLLIA